MTFNPQRCIGTIVLFWLLGCSIGNASEYYWVGGSGNWSDIRHWATTSGGTTQHNVIPSAADDVFFDSNSFTGAGQVVTINNQNVFCRSMNWDGVSGNPRLAGPEAHAINISGDFILNANMQFAFLGDVRLEGDGTGIINTFGKRLRKILEVNGTNASMWTLQGNLQVDSLIKINSGGLNTNGSMVVVEQMLVYASSTTNLNLSNSTIRITGSIKIQERDDYWSYPIFGMNTSNLNLEGGTSTVEFSGRFPSLRIYGDKNVNFNNLNFSSSQGVALINYLRNFQWEFFNFNGNSPIIGSNQMVFNSNGLVFSDHMINELQLSQAKSYRFENDRTLIIQSLVAVGACDKPITVNSTRPSGNSTFQFRSNQSVDFVNIRNIHAAGTGNFVASNSVDLGNNDGWMINSRTGTTLFWVGGQGKWSDPNHWSLMSGGTGGGCIPSPRDKVVFDQNSFSGPDSVIIDVDDALCGDMTWENLDADPIFASKEQQSLNVFGSLKFDSRIDVQLLGNVNFLSNGSTTIDLAGLRFIRDVYFAGRGEWNFDSDFETVRFVHFVSGHINTQSNKFIFERLESDFNGQRKLTIENSEVIARTERHWFTYIHIYAGTFDLEASNSRVIFNADGRLSQWGDYDVSNPMGWNIVTFNGFGAFESSRADTKAKLVEIYGNGDIRGNFEIGRLYLNPGYSYEFLEWDLDREKIQIDTLDASGRCDANIIISSHFENMVSRIFSDWNQTGDYLIIEDMSFIGATFTANQSIDQGNNTGWIIGDIEGRDLYWVGGSGSWEETAHWSLVSGGSGGECIPTSRDNVYFDNNSFSGPDQSVIANNFYTATCRNFVWDGPPESTRFSRRNEDGWCCGGFLVYGSWDVRTPFIPELYEVEFRGNEPEHIINTSNVYISDYYFRCEGNRTLTDSMYTGALRFDGGQLKTNSQFVESGRIEVYAYYANVHLDFDSSHVLLTREGTTSHGTFNLWNDNQFSFDAGTSTIELNNPNSTSILWQGNHSLYDVIFSAPTGTGYMTRIGNEEDRSGNVNVNLLQFGSDGFMYGDHTIDTLLFATGRSYTLESEKVQKINDHLQIRGNNCIQLRLKATQGGNPSIIEKRDGQVDGDFIQMQDQIARGGATFYAGENSTDLSNNTGWIFESAEEYVEFGLLGDDVVFCKGESELVLNEEDQIGAMSYGWSDGSNEKQLQINNPGTYWVQATYDNNCELYDTIRILEQDDFQPDIGPDETLCPDQVLEVNADLDLTGATYTWGDSTTGPMRTLDQSGEYVLLVELNGCTNSDTLKLDYVEVPDFNLESGGEACLGDTVTLDATINGVTVLWSTGSTDPLLDITESDIYWLTISKEGCEASDTIDINFIIPPSFELGNDTILCEGQVLNTGFLSPVVNAEYTWNDGVNAVERNIDLTGFYKLTGNIGSCAYSDSFNVEVIAIPQLALEPDQQICAGETVSLDATIPGASVQWSTGNTNALIDLTQSGEFWLRISKEGCIAVDTFELVFTEPPQFTLGNDITVCSGDDVVLDVAVTGATYQWSNNQSTPTININPVSPQIISVISSFGRCSSSDSIDINVKPLPVVSLGDDLSFCPGEQFSLSVETNGDFFEWFDGSTETDRTFIDPGSYQVMALLNGCINIAEVNSSHFPTFFKDLGPDTLICDDDSYAIDISIENGQYTWSDGSVDGMRSLQEAGTYGVQVFDGNCSFEDEFVLSTRECIYFNLFTPNIFSPNDDGVNDVFTPLFDPRIQVNEYQFQVFNRWGSLLYETTDPFQGWDGSINGSALGSEVYVFRVEIDYVDDNGPGSLQSGGDVLLMK